VSDAVGSVPLGAVPRAGARPWAGVATSPWAVAGTVFLVYGLWLAAMFHNGYDARDSIVLGKTFVLKSHSSSVIKLDRHYTYPGGASGYDGQYFYFIAVDPLHARYYMDNAGHRYTKILYPAAAGLPAFGRASLVPYTLILINWLAIAGTAGLLALWLRRKGASPWFALIYALCPGVWVSFQRDLTEPLSYGLVALAVYLYDFGGRYRAVWSGLAFAGAVLTRDKAAIFAAVYGLGFVLRGFDLRQPRGLSDRIIRNGVQGGVFGILALGPYLVWRQVVGHWLRTAVSTSGVSTSYQAAPLSGAVMQGLNVETRLLFLFVLFIPAAICAAMGIWALVRRVWTVPIVTLLVLIELSVVTLNPGYFADVYGVLRVEAGVILAAILCIPAFGKLTRGNQLWLYACGGGWLFLTVAYALLAPAWLLGGRA
jgi:hypothetical protein